MSLDLSPGNLLNFASGALLLALGVFVARVRPRRRGNAAFAVFSISMGLAFTVQNTLRGDDPLWLAVNVGGWMLSLPSSAALPLLAWWLPRTLPAAQRRQGWLAVGIGLAVAAVALGLFVAGLEELRAFVDSTPGREADAVSSDPATTFAAVQVLLPLALLHQAMFVAALLLLAVRWGAAPAEERPLLALMSAALVLYPGLVAGIYAAFPPGLRESGGVLVGGFVLVGAVWIRNTQLASGREARMARNLALLALAMPLLGLALTPLAGGGPQALASGLTGLARTFTVILLAYAILRRQLLGLDVRVRWTVKQSTVAAAFIGVFFVVSESASQFFTGSVGPYLGIAAAGLLVFALAPLQRVAERVASAALPGARPATEMSASERATFYREQARIAWQDGVLTADERRLLDGARERLRLSREEAAALEDEVMPR